MSATPTDTVRYVYSFGRDGADGGAEQADLLGGKGANLAEMTRLGLPVPPGFTISTTACAEYYAKSRILSDAVRSQVQTALSALEAEMDARLGDASSPLLVSVRSGAVVSMPGMMDTVLNLGLNDETVEGLAVRSGNRRFALDSYRRFIQTFADVVMGVRLDSLEHLLEGIKAREGITEDHHLTEAHLEELIGRYKATVWKTAGEPFPQEPFEQLWRSIRAVLESWNNRRAHDYRAMHGIPHDLYTAATVQAMVFGNLSDDSATGVAFTRNPSTGERRFYGEFLPNAQGEDVVAGIRTPRPISAEGREEWEPESLEETMPDVHRELLAVSAKLESHFGDMQDIEFTVQEGRLFLLQTRRGKRTARAALRIAVELVDEGVIDETAAIHRVEPSQLDQLLHPSFSPDSLATARQEGRRLLKGLPASPGAETGQVVFTAADAVEWVSRGLHVVLMRNETSPEDIQGMAKAAAIVTARGGMTSHAAVVARGMGKCCVVGSAAFRVNEAAQIASFDDGREIKQGDIVSVDGSTGEVILGAVDTIQPTLGEDFERLMGWADRVRRLRVRANADTPHDAQVASHFGAEGIGLCRTEHMFFSGDRIAAVREMILADDETGRRKALEKIRPMQRTDFEGIFEVMQQRPTTIRLLDPPLHEFLPQNDREVEEVAAATQKTAEQVRQKIESLREVNPMLGHRGCRLGVTFPEIYEMQTEAIIEAACTVSERLGIRITPEIMIPLVCTPRELELLREVCRNAAERAMTQSKVKLDFLIGTMIELPRAALTADRVAQFADFFSFGTNDLTQTTLGLSRDDSSTFLPLYVSTGMFEADPFVKLDEAVVMLLEIGTERGRATKPDLKVGICGEHGGEPSAVHRCHQLGLDYVSCSPYRVPIARLAAAQAATMPPRGAS